MVVRGVQMFSGLAGSERDQPAWRPLARITDFCGLTLQGGVEEDGGSALEGSLSHQPARRRDHLRLVSHRRSPC